ncbi:uncharacterized protein LOC111800419 [Cucurbita pepo subsp. pepo]|uniref:uncharacterized protein LOC111800419 n=1 Tax=Cucurbita pepo subsp. pepo TaxID=3664 RepID=UPI000C9D6745|nr:uncharacterized protein LOC111800419 [Cucurbita pepo subsp. pepo]
MACEAIQQWTFNGLVAAFLDLGIAYLVLCASSLVFFTSKFLALFGLCLPCPCDGLFGNLSSDHCFQKILVDRSSKKVSSVIHSAREKLPLNSMWDQEPKCCFKSTLMHERNGNKAHVESEGEPSDDSFSKTRSLQAMIYGDFHSVKESRCNGDVDHKKVMSVSPNDISQLDMEDLSLSPSSFSGFGDNNTEDGFFSVDSGDEREESSSDNSDQCKVFPDEKIWAEKFVASFEEAGSKCRGELCLDGNESDTIKLLEQALEEEQMARATLYLELEKERSAAATATDEAMAMILRLQEEKASIEMDARQYQRMIEEKTAYDAEEMSILKEILVRREREMHFLEKEVEAFQKSFFEDDGVDVDMLDPEITPQGVPSFAYSSKGPSHMLQCIHRSIRDKQDANYTKRSSQYEIPSIELRKLTFEFEDESPFIHSDEHADAAEAGGMLLHQAADNFMIKEENDNELQEKGMVEDENLYILQGEVNELEPYLQSNMSNGLDKVEKSTELEPIADEREKVDEVSYDGLASAKTIIPCVEYNLEKNGDHQKQQPKDLDSMTNIDPQSHDIHVIDEEASTCDDVSADASKEPVINGTSSFPANCYSPSFSLLQSELDITRSNSDASGRFPPFARSRSNCLRSELRRNSMSAVDYERSKIGDEVESLRERLKIVQEEREKLRFSLEHKDKENNQLQLLESITNHLREIRQLTDPGKAILQAPFPPSSKGVSKKRCWRSSSLSIHRSS